MPGRDPAVHGRDSRRVSFLGVPHASPVTVHLQRRDGAPDSWATIDGSGRCFWSPERAIMDWAYRTDRDVVGIVPAGEPTREELLDALRSLLDCPTAEPPAGVFARLSALVARRRCRILRDELLARGGLGAEEREELERLNERGDGLIDESPAMLAARAAIFHAASSHRLAAAADERRAVRREMKLRCLEAVLSGAVSPAEMYDVRDYASDPACAEAAPRLAGELIRARLEMERVSVEDVEPLVLPPVSRRDAAEVEIERLEARLAAAREELRAAVREEVAAR